MKTSIRTDNLYKVLIGLIGQVKRDDLGTVEALLFDMTGSRTAALMLRQLMNWWPKSSDPAGWVYKSHLDWWAELRIKQNELPKANGALEMIGVVIQNKKANGAPTKHYRLDMKAFFKAVARTLKLSAKKLSLHLQNAFAKRAEMDLSNGHKSITTKPSTNPPTNSNAVLLDNAIQKAKEIPGIQDPTARKLVGQYGPERVIAMVALIQAPRKKAWDSPSGALIQGLREQWECAAVETQSAGAASEWTDWRGKDGDDNPTPEIQKTPVLPEQEDLSEMDTHPDEADPDATEPVDVPISHEAVEAWNKAYSQLEIQLDRASFDTFLRGAWLVSAEGWNLTVGVSNIYAAQILEHRMKRDICRVVSDIAGTNVDLQFVVEKMHKAYPTEEPLFKRLARGAA